RRNSDERFALYVEEREPSLRQSLLAAVQEAHLPTSARPSPSLSARVMTRAIAAIDPIAARSALERPRLLRAGKALAVVSSVSALMLWFGPQSLRDGARLLFVPFGTAQAAVPVLRLAVSPGNVSVPRGGAIEVEATLVGFTASNAELVFRSDSSGEWQRLPMAPDSDSAGFRSRLFDIVQRTEYYVEAAEVQSPVFTLVVNDLPAVSRVSLDLRFPSYSGLPAEHIEETGDVAAVAGTSVTVRARVTRAVSGGTLRFDDGRTVPMTRESDSTVTGAFTVKKSGFYHVDLTTTDGATVAGAVEYVVDAIPDRAPIVRIEEPGRDTKVTNTDEVTIAVQAS
ncbi:MAG: hypothetical protein EBV77_13800, partial [Gemmatimonadaceae bacterium]|nr:hypothetical protein [Gemmatimonadaceae bacterium]